MSNKIKGIKGISYNTKNILFLVNINGFRAIFH